LTARSSPPPRCGTGGGTTAELYDGASGTWSAAGALHVARADQVAVRLADGRVLVAGGSYSATAEMHDPGTHSWTLTGSMRTDRVNVACVLLSDGRVLVAGGNSEQHGLLASAEVYDLAIGRFTLTGAVRCV